MKDTNTKRLDWVKVLTDEARLTDVVVVDELAAKYNLPAASAWRAASRLTKRGLLSRVSNGVYLNKLV
jgi:predicted transcriptional regulator of viral defense system